MGIITPAHRELGTGGAEMRAQRLAEGPGYENAPALFRRGRALKSGGIRPQRVTAFQLQNAITVRRVVRMVAV